MQIGGDDITVSVGVQVNKDLICQIVGTFWQDGVFQDLPDIQGLEEYFFFKTEADRQSWDEHGLTDENKDTLIHVLHDRPGQQMTFVVFEGANSETRSIVDQVIKQIL